MNFKLLAVVGGAVGLVAGAGPASALSIQSVNAGSFTTNGTAASSPISFAPFTAGPAEWLTSINLRIVNGAFSEQIVLQKTNTSTAGRKMTAEAAPTFSYGFGGMSATSSAFNSVITGTDTVPNATQLIVTSASGTWSQPFSSLSLDTTAKRNYFTGSPQITSYQTAYKYANCTTLTGASTNTCLIVAQDDPQEPIPFTATKFSGTLFVDYGYNIPAGAIAPSPLPLLGAGAAFSMTRRLRRRIKSVA
ncbi:MAG: hypothetical protein ACKO5F_02570 [Synechococcus sp.]